MTSNLVVFLVQMFMVIIIAMVAPNMGYAGGFLLLMAVYWGGYIAGVRDVERSISDVAQKLRMLAESYREEAKNMKKEEEPTDGK